jgi:hypothetical protein
MNSFDDFWRDYPRKVSKKDARKAWDRAVKVELPAVIIMGLKRQIQYLESRPVEFRPHAATWLNGERWEDEVQQNVAPPKPKSEFMQHQDDVQRELDKALGRKRDDEFTGNTLDLETGNWRAH